MGLGNPIGFLNYLANGGKPNERDAKDGWGGMPSGWGQRGNFGKMPSLQQHDVQFHGGHYDGKGKCSYRQQMGKGDGNDVLPGFAMPSVSAHHGMFDNPWEQMTPQERDQEAVKDVCAKMGVKYPANGKVQSGRWSTALSPKLEYTVVDPETGLFASGRASRDYMVLARSEEAMSFSDRDDAAAVAAATGGNAQVLDRKGYAAFLSKGMKNPCNFPTTLTEADLDGFRVTLNGSTEPYVGKIGDSMFIAKKGSHTSADHVENEHIANELHLAAGLNAPRSRMYDVSVGKDTRTAAEKYMDLVNGVKDAGKKERVMLAEYIPNAVSLEAAWNDSVKTGDKAMQKKIRDQVLAAYPFESFVAGIDLFQNDNALVDNDGKLWMVDNGAAFDFRARGGRNGWFNSRTDPDDPNNGLMSLLNHRSQTLLQGILKGVTEQDVLKAAKRYDFEELVKKLPPEYQTQGLKAYAKALNDKAKAA